VPEDGAGALVLEIDDIHVKGEHAFWVSHVRGALPGEVRGSFRLDTRAGRLSLSGGALDLALARLQVGPEQPVTGGASIRGEIDIPAFAISETEGLEALRLPHVDAKIDLPVQDLDFLAWVLPGLQAIDLRGEGRLRGRLVMSGGEALRGTDLAVEAHRLAMHLGRYGFSGDGLVEFLVDPEDEAQADLIVRFDQVRAELRPVDGRGAGRPQVLFSGRGLTAQLHAAEADPTTTSTATLPQALASEVFFRFVLSIPSMEVADLAVYDRLFPETWDVALLGGAGRVSGDLEVTEEALSLDLELVSDEADLRLAGYHANTDLLLKLRAELSSAGAGADSAALDLAGTLLRLEEAQLAGVADVGSPASWSAALRVGETDLTLPLSPELTEDGTIRGLVRTLSDQGFGTLLAAADGTASAALTISRLDWIAELLDRPLGLGLGGGGGELDARILLSDGIPAAGSSLHVPPQALSVGFLDHRVEGSGRASVRLEGGRGPARARLAVAFDDARLRRRDEDEPSVADVRMDAEILVTDPFSASVADAELSLAIHSARVTDMSSYNPYLPGHAPVSILGGEASLVGELQVTPDTAAGDLLVTAGGVRLAVADQELSGDLRLELLIRDGSAEDLRFDITGSSLVLDGWRVAGPTASTSDDHWHARLQLDDTQVLWHKPMQLGTKAYVTMKDTRPFVAVLDNLREEHGWIDNLLTVEDLGGEAVLSLDGDAAVLEDAVIAGSGVGVHAKGRFGTAGREAMLLVRWQGLSAAMELKDERRHFDVVDARGRFDAYAPGRTPLPFLRGHPAYVMPASGQGAASGAHAPAPARARGEERPRRAAGASSEARPPAEPANPFLDHSL
jgi:hypothetical protein